MQKDCLVNLSCWMMAEVLKVCMKASSRNEILGHLVVSHSEAWMLPSYLFGGAESGGQD